MNAKQLSLPKKHLPLTWFELNPQLEYDFTFRELSCYHYLICDYSVQEVAEILHVSDSAIYKMRERLMLKAGVDKFEALTGWLLHHRIIKLYDLKAFP